MLAACGAHALHDGYTDLLYVLLPLWQGEFGLGYAQVGLLRALYAGVMASFQVPAGWLAGRVVSGAALLVGGTALAALGYLAVGASGSFPLLMAALALGGLGSSVQHPIGSSLVARAFEGRRSRGALGTYNFSGDLGKMALPAATAWLVTWLPWRTVAGLLGVFGLVAAGGIALGLRRSRNAVAAGASSPEASGATPPGLMPGHVPSSRRGFSVLLAIGVIDSATRMGFLTFLPFLLAARGAGQGTVGLALALVFAGGSAGKFVCGFLGARLGVLRTVFLTEGLTAAGILALLAPGLPLGAALALLAPVGVALNGTSSVLYGTVPELVTPERRERAFGVFYTGTIGAGAISPVFYGWFSDAAGVPTMMALIAGVVLLTLPLAWRLRLMLEGRGANL